MSYYEKLAVRHEFADRFMVAIDNLPKPDRVLIKLAKRMGGNSARIEPLAYRGVFAKPSTDADYR
jgi:hypothetical protein